MTPTLTTTTDQRDECVDPPPSRNPLTQPLLAALRLVRVLRAEALAYAELLQLALDLIRELEQEIMRLRSSYHGLLDARRAERRKDA